jgi:hypothetical protein
VGNAFLGLRIRIDQPLPRTYRPALAWKAQLSSCRLLPAGWSVGYGASYVTPCEECIGVIPVGYGDGLRRVPGNQVIIDGIKCPVVGTLCLDQMMVRLPRHYPMGEEVMRPTRQYVDLGTQSGPALWNITSGFHYPDPPPRVKDLCVPTNYWWSSNPECKPRNIYLN